MLFLADRTALVNQAANAFKTHLPGVTTVNLVTEKARDGRVYVSTYPTMMGLINEIDDGARRFGPGYFDLIVIDEAHRSVYQKYRAIFDWFDSPARRPDRDPQGRGRPQHLPARSTWRDGVPTDAYGLDEAVEDGFLVPPFGVSVRHQVPAPGHHVRRPVRGGEGRVGRPRLGRGRPVPTAIDAEELNRCLFNEDTVDKVLAT